MITNAWKDQNYVFVGKAFDFAYANMLNKLLGVMGKTTTTSVDYELTGSGGYGEMPLYDGTNLNMAQLHKGFKSVITPLERSETVQIGYAQAKVDKSGECRKVGAKLGNIAGMTVYVNALRMFGNAFNPNQLGGDGKPWAATDHPVASMGSEGRRYIPDPDAGTFSNLITTPLSVSAITAAQSAANRFITPDGLPFLCDFNMLLVSPELEAEAKKICGDFGKYRPTRNPEDDTNAANPVPDLQYMVLGGGKDGFTKKQWAICDARLMKEMCKIIYITEPECIHNETGNPLIDQYTGYVHFGCGWGDARPIIFSNPS